MLPSWPEMSWPVLDVDALRPIAPGLWVLRLPIPSASLRYVHCYIFDVDGGVHLVDPGWDWTPGLDALNAGLDRIGGSIADVRSMTITHAHRDHYGQAALIREQSGAVIGIHELDARVAAQSSQSRIDGVHTSLQRAGVPKADMDSLMGELVDLPRFDTDLCLSDGDRLALPGWNVEVIWTPGHSPGHICLYLHEQATLLSGDHLLPRITPNIPSDSSSMANPLGAYLHSLDRLRLLPVRTVWPAHEWSFDDHITRIDQLREHHAARLDEVVMALTAGAKTAWQVAAEMTWARPWTGMGATRRSAVVEALAHLRLLEADERVRETTGPTSIWSASAVNGAIAP
jgi:glyoxylase-like metal-dependent hydrolase (beta-lactamase superfamily II)